MTQKMLLILVMILGVTLGVSRHYYHKKISALQNDYATWAGTISTLVSEKDSALVALAIKTEELEINNDAITDNLRASKSKIRAITQVVAAYERNIGAETTSVDTVYINVKGDSVESRAFSGNFDNVHISGDFDKYSPWNIRFSNIAIDSLGFTIILAESSDKSWRTYIEDLPIGLKISKIDTKVAPYKAPWYTAFHLNAEVNSNGGGLGAGYGPFTGMYYLDKSIGLEYQYQIWK